MFSVPKLIKLTGENVITIDCVITDHVCCSAYLTYIIYCRIIYLQSPNDDGDDGQDGRDGDADGDGDYDDDDNDDNDDHGDVARSNLTISYNSNHPVTEFYTYFC